MACHETVWEWAQLQRELELRRRFCAALAQRCYIVISLPDDLRQHVLDMQEHAKQFFDQPSEVRRALGALRLFKHKVIGYREMGEGLSRFLEVHALAGGGSIPRTKTPSSLGPIAERLHAGLQAIARELLEWMAAYIEVPSEALLQCLDTPSLDNLDRGDCSASVLRLCSYGVAELEGSFNKGELPARPRRKMSAASEAVGIATEEACALTPFNILPRTALAFAIAPWIGCIKALSRLVNTARAVREELVDQHGQLLTCSLVAATPSSAQFALRCVKLMHVEVLHLNLADLGKPCRICNEQLNETLQQLGRMLAHASSLEVLAIRLPAFDKEMERLRLKRDTWRPLLHGLRELAGHGRLRSLELTYVALKRAWVQEGSHAPVGVNEDVEAPPAEIPEVSSMVSAERSTPSFLEVLANLASLEELVLRHNEIFGDFAKELVGSLPMTSLRRLDLTRNHISRRAMEEVRQIIPPTVELLGEEGQTLYY